jgi:hypothetical protein
MLVGYCTCDCSGSLFSLRLQLHFDALEAAVLAGTLPQDALLAGLSYLVGMTDNDETEIFKMCLDYWLHFANQLHAYEKAFVQSVAAVSVQSVSATLVIAQSPVTVDVTIDGKGAVV